MIESRIFNCIEHKFKKFKDFKGTLEVIEGLKDLSNNIIKFERCYVLSDFINNKVRGQHAHKKLYQLLFALNGSFSVDLYDGFDKKVVNLSEGSALLIVPGIWRELNNYSDNLFVVVLASDKYDESDYIYKKRDFEKYKKV